MATKKKTGTSKASIQAEYEALMEGRDLEKAVEYSASSEFMKEELMEHTAFGLGIVTKNLSDNKIEVMFRTGHKILVHNRT